MDIRKGLLFGFNHGVKNWYEKYGLRFDHLEYHDPIYTVINTPGITNNYCPKLKCLQPWYVEYVTKSVRWANIAIYVVNNWDQSETLVALKMMEEQVLCKTIILINFVRYDAPYSNTFASHVLYNVQKKLEEQNITTNFPLIAMPLHCKYYEGPCLWLLEDAQQELISAIKNMQDKPFVLDDKIPYEFMNNRNSWVLTNLMKNIQKYYDFVGNSDKTNKSTITKEVEVKKENIKAALNLTITSWYDMLLLSKGRNDNDYIIKHYPKPSFSSCLKSTLENKNIVTGVCGLHLVLKMVYAFHL